MAELLPCPFCGSKAKLHAFPRRFIYYVACTRTECRAEMGLRSLNSERAIEQWNTRIQPAPAAIAMPGTGCSACGWANGDWVCNDKCRPQ